MVNGSTEIVGKSTLVQVIVACVYTVNNDPRLVNMVFSMWYGYCMQGQRDSVYMCFRFKAHHHKRVIHAIYARQGIEIVFDYFPADARTCDTDIFACFFL